jgi:hypothetical protein
MRGDRGHTNCVCCDEWRENEGRGLCARCYWRHWKRGTLDQFPRRHVPAADLVEDYEFLRRQGYTRRTAAERMGISKKRLEKAIERQARRMQEAS